jgi:hypothetical protein
MSNHARTRFLPAAALALAACNLAHAQTGATLLVAPFPKEQFTDIRGSWLYEDAGHVKGSDESLRLAFYETAGRVRLIPGNLTSPRVGWEFEYIDVRGNPGVLPGQLTDESVGVAFPVAKVDEWIFGLALGVGYAGASPFGEGGAWYGKATAVAFRQFSESDALVFVLDYDGNRTFLPDVPLPGVAYTRRVNPTLFYVVGLPLSSVTWKPFEKFSLEAGWYPIESFHAAAGYEFTPHWSAFASLDYNSSAFRLDGLSGNDRLIFQQRRAELGLRFAPRVGRDTFALTAAAGYAWGQEFSAGFDSRRTDEVADASDEPYVRVGFEVKF